MSCRMKQEILSFLLFIILITSCTFNNQNDAELEKELYKGTEGVVLEYFETNFPDEVFEGEGLDYAVRITNKGPYQPHNMLLLVSLEKSYMTFGDDPDALENIRIVNNLEPLDGKTIFNPLDDFEVIELPMTVKSLDDLSEYHDTFILTTLCYDYKGIAIADVCIDQDPHDTSPREKECDVKESISLSEGQGGPVVIDRIETRMMVDKGDRIRPQFKIYVSNRGQGTVLKQGTTRLVCNKESLNTETYNSIKIDKIEFSGFSTQNIECIPSELVLRNEEDFVTCTLRESFSLPKKAEAFQTPLIIEISYGYMESSSKEIKIKKILPY